MAKRPQSIDTKIRHIKQQLLVLGSLRPGALSEQYNVCGKAACRCKAQPPQKHGPYYQLSFTWKARSRTQFIRRPEVAEVKRQLRNYRRLRSLVDEWIALELEQAQLKRDGA